MSESRKNRHSRGLAVATVSEGEPYIGRQMSEFAGRDVRFSNRPFGVKRFQTIHHTSVEVAHGLALLFGIGTKALPAWDPRMRWNNLLDGLAGKLTAGPSRHTISRHPSSREGHHSTAWWNSIFSYRI